MKVHRSAFTPPPKIMSAIVHVTPGDQPAGVEPKLLSKLTEKGFGQRRKMLRQSLKGIEGAVAAAEALGIAPTRRAETVRVGEWVALARDVGGENPSCPVAVATRAPTCFGPPPQTGRA